VVFIAFERPLIYSSSLLLASLVNLIPTPKAINPTPIRPNFSLPSSAKIPTIFLPVNNCKIDDSANYGPVI